MDEGLAGYVQSWVTQNSSSSLGRVVKRRCHKTSVICSSHWGLGKEATTTSGDWFLTLFFVNITGFSSVSLNTAK